MNYQLSVSPTEVAFTNDEGKRFAINPESRQWPAYQTWLANGNVAIPAKVRAVLSDEASVSIKLSNDKLMNALIKVLADRLGITKADLIQSIKAAI